MEEGGQDGGGGDIRGGAPEAQAGRPCSGRTSTGEAAGQHGHHEDGAAGADGVKITDICGSVSTMSALIVTLLP